MPRGHDLSRDVKDLLYTHLIAKDEAPDYTHDNTFAGNRNIITLSYITKLKTKLKKMSDNQILIWKSDPNINNKNKRTGRRTRFGSEVRASILMIDRAHKQKKIKIVAKIHKEKYYTLANRKNAPSRRTVHRIISNHGITRKVVEHRNINRNPIRELNFWRANEHIHEDKWIDTDEMKMNDDDLLNKYGREEEGKRCVRHQLRVGGIFFSLFASMTTIGFSCWEINEKIHTSDDFISYVEGILGPKLRQGQVGLFDNASIHKTIDAVISINVHFNGLYSFVPQYSPHMKPIELGFAMIRKWLEEHDELCESNPRLALETAFHLHSEIGPYGYKCRNFWRQYKRNHLFYLKSLAL